jgi:hypothetical protein
MSHVPFNRAIRELHDHLNRIGIRHQVVDLPGDSLIPRARNLFANVACFDKGPDGVPFTHLLFIDADIGFNARDIESMLAWNKDICGLPYTRKSLNWPAIIMAVQKGVTDHGVLSHVAGHPVINTNGEQIDFDVSKPVQFPQLGTGCLLIHRRVLEKFAEDKSREYCLMEGERQSGVDPSRKFAIDFFQIGINKKSKYYDSEDYRFCLDARDMGFETWMLPWAVTVHQGVYSYWMDIAATAGLGIPLGDIPVEKAKVCETVKVQS